MTEERERKTEPGGLKPSTPPGEMTDLDMLREILLTVRSLDVRVGTIERESTDTRKRLDELVLEIVPRVEKLESAVEAITAKVVILRHWQDSHEDGCGHPGCPHRKVYAG